ncbi:MAG: sugar phosphate isomerase/epimerase [Acidobacteria bacterium]|nr:sugar phosphate isomerase/epimerase [Acidobacteriota bacterium]
MIDRHAVHHLILEQPSRQLPRSVGFHSHSVRDVGHRPPDSGDVAGSGEVKHVVELNKAEYRALRKLHEEYGMYVTSIGARVGKVKLLDVDDGSHNVFVPFKKYLTGEVKATIRAAHELETKLIRGFSFYHPRGTDPHEHVAQAADQIGAIVDLCAKEDLVYGLEIEPNLVGETGSLMAALSKAVNRPNMVLIWDGGNVAAQNKNPITVYEEFKQMRPYLGWMHVKDYANRVGDTWTGDRGAGAIDEGKLKHFVPADVGDAAHEFVLRNLRLHLPQLERKMKKLGAPGFFLEVEPHLKGGGQFGGFSGPDGMGVAVRALCRVLDYARIDYNLRSFADIQKARGF